MQSLIIFGDKWDLLTAAHLICIPTLRQLKSCRLHSLVVPSAEDVASTWSTGEKQTAQTPRRCPRNTPSRPTFPSPDSDHSLAVRSWEPEASSLSLGDTATLFTSWRRSQWRRCLIRNNFSHYVEDFNSCQIKARNSLKEGKLRNKEEKSAEQEIEIWMIQIKDRQITTLLCQLTHYHWYLACWNRICSRNVSTKASYVTRNCWRTDWRSLCESGVRRCSRKQWLVGILLPRNLLWVIGYSKDQVASRFSALPYEKNQLAQNWL